MNQSTLHAWLTLARAHALQSTHVRRALLYLAPDELLSTIHDQPIPPSIINRIAAIQSTFNIDRELNELEKHSVQIIDWQNKDYPALLKQIHDPPPLLFYKGGLPEPDRVLVSIVGSRRATHYGRDVTQSITRHLVHHQLGIVSGLAYGIDGEAHRATLEAGGYTVAILAGGLGSDTISPHQHKNLAQEIVTSGGCLMSENPIGTASEAYQFPRRNRIVAGLSRATLVVEATRKSGSLISADCALSENREVLAIPGPITSSRSAGTHDLIRSGATLITCADDIIEAIDIEASQTAQVVSSQATATESENTILQHLDHEPKLIDDLARELNLPVTTLTGQLTLLELKRLVKLLPGGYVIATTH